MNTDGVLLDLDGTLLNSTGHMYRGVCAVFEACGLPSPSFVEYATTVRSPYMDFYRSRGVTASREDIYRIYHDASKSEQALLFEDAVPIIKQLVSMRLELGIITAERKEVVKMHMSRFGLWDLVPFIVVEAQEKTYPILRFAKRFRIAMSRITFVGDFISDVEDSRSMGTCAVGITRGNPTREALLKAGAHHCIDHLHELLPIVRGEVTA